MLERGAGSNIQQIRVPNFGPDFGPDLPRARIIVVCALGVVSTDGHLLEVLVPLPSSLLVAHSMTKVKNRKPSQVPKTEKEPLVDISEADQWRIIKESGILQQVPRVDLVQNPSQATEEEEQLLSPLTEEIFSALSLIIPHSFLLLMMEL